MVANFGIGWVSTKKDVWDGYSLRNFDSLENYAAGSRQGRAR